jgi:hypothetical protein
MNNLETVTCRRTCPMCKKEQELEVRYAEYQAWRNGALVQHAFKSLSPSEREVLISGTCSSCWDEMFNFKD